MSTRIDLHSHTQGSDGFGTAEQIVAAARAARLHGLCLTDHHRTYTPESDKVAAALEAAGIMAFRGAEYSTDSGHLLVYGVAVEDFGFGYHPPIQEVIDAVVAAGGVCVPSHPYKGYARTLNDKVKTLKRVAAYEAVNGQCAYQCPEANRLAQRAATERRRRSTGGSDAHDPRDIGLAYTRFEADITNERQFLAALKRGAYAPVLSQGRLEAARKRRVVLWSPPKVYPQGPWRRGETRGKWGE